MSFTGAAAGTEPGYFATRPPVSELFSLMPPVKSFASWSRKTKWWLSFCRLPAPEILPLRCWRMLASFEYVRR